MGATVIVAAMMCMVAPVVEAEPDPRALQFKINCRVEDFGLASEGGKLMNGCKGRVLRFLSDKGRWEVKLNKTEDCESKVVSLKPDNLRVPETSDERGDDAQRHKSRSRSRSQKRATSKETAEE